MNILMPQLGETVSEGTILTWYKRQGDTIRVDEVLLEIETDKAAVEVPAPMSGVLRSVLVQAGQTVAVGAVLAVMESLDSSAATVTPVASVPPVAASPPMVTAPATPTALPPAERWPRAQKWDRARQPLSPSVRRLVREYALDPASITGGGRNGRIRRKDVLDHVGRPSSAKGPQSIGGLPDAAIDGTLVPFNRLRKRIAEHMVRSKSTSPHVLQAIEADFSEVVAVRNRNKAAVQGRYGVALTYLPFVAYAICRALTKFPTLNACVEGEGVRLHADVNLAVAVDLNFEGLVAPVLPRAQTFTVAGLAVAIHEMTQRVRAGKFSPDEVGGGTYTLSNSGSFGTLITAPIINQPQVAILSMDGIHKRVAVIESLQGDSMAIRPMGVLAQSFDHRAIDGAYSAAYLRALKQVIENCAWEAALGV